MKPAKKIKKAMERRTESFKKTMERQERNNFRPNASGPTHEQKAPGSRNKKKLGLA